MDDLELDADGLTFRVDQIDLTEVEIRVAREDRQTWRWQVLYVGAVQVEGITHEGETEAFQRAQQHRDVWLEHELEAIRRLLAEF
jgi:hypothetical protein